MKKIIPLFLILFTNTLFSQRVKITVKNDSINTKISFKTLTNEVLKTVFVKEDNFDTDIDVEEGYYLLEKDENELLLYLKRSDDLSIFFDNENFYNSVVFTGSGAKRNTYLLNKKLDYLDKKGRPQNFYKKGFYKGDENTYLETLDAYYKNFFGMLFSNGYDKMFVDEEMKNLQYGYSFDLLKFEDAKKHYKFNDSTEVSSNFLEPLNYIHFDKSELAKRYDSYKKLAILKWTKDIKNSPNIKMMQDVFSSIRTESIQQGVLQSLYNEMYDGNSNTKNYYNLIKSNSDDFLLVAKAKEKYNDIRHIVAEKNLSKHTFKNALEEKVTLSNFKGNYIFLTLWLPSCKSCVETLKEVERLKKKYKGDKIVFVSIAIANKDDYKDWKTTIEKNLLLENQFFYEGSKQRIVREYNISSLPSFVILSLKGEVLESSIQEPTSKETKKLIKKLLRQE